MNTIDLILSPELIPFYPTSGETPTVYVVADILRASTSITAAFASGVRLIYPLASVEEARKKAEKGYMVGAERNAQKLDFATFGNDPLEYTRAMVEGKEIYFTTTNGTKAIWACFNANPQAEVVIGSFPNRSAVARFCQGKDVVVIAAGWNGKVALEDALYGATLYELLKETHTPASDALRMILPLYHRDTLMSDVQECDHYARLQRTGQTASLEYCLTPDTSDVLPKARLCSSHNEIIISL